MRSTLKDEDMSGLQRQIYAILFAEIFSCFQKMAPWWRPMEKG